jgi:hypothetical protein
MWRVANSWTLVMLGTELIALEMEIQLSCDQLTVYMLSYVIGHHITIVIVIDIVIYSK